MNRNGLIIALIVIVVSLAGIFFTQTMQESGRETMPGHDGETMNPPNDAAPDEADGPDLVEEGATGSEGNPLPIPPLLEDENPEDGKAEFSFTAQKGETEFFEGQPAETYGYNGTYLGPVIRVRNGDEVTMNVENDLGEETTVHWHGLEVYGEADGGPHSVINPGETWSPEFQVDQPAATLWYHPHTLHKTGEQVYKGLAGLLFVEDDVSDSLDIPKDYGENDIPLIVQDKEFLSDGSFEYNLSMPDIMMGLHGDTPLINGAVNPYVEVPQGKVRFRILNGSNARTYDFQLSGGEPFHQIATDGGFLEQPVEMNSVTLSSAERAEIIVDFSEFQEGDTVELTDQGTGLMSFRVTGEEGMQADLPEELTEIEWLDPDEADTTREFVMGGMGPNVNINGRQFDMNRMDAEVNLDAVEIWEISNDSGGMMGGMGGMGGMNDRGMIHPFHIHGIQFQVLDRDGNPPPENERGWKDTVLVHPDETVRVIAQFKHPGIFMFHCHILEHEDAGMMGQFEIK